MLLVYFFVIMLHINDCTGFHRYEVVSNNLSSLHCFHSCFFVVVVFYLIKSICSTKDYRNKVFIV